MESIILSPYKPEHFELYELVYPEIYQQYHKLNKLHLLWGILDTRMLWTIDQLRKRYGSIIINNWYQKHDNSFIVKSGPGVFKESGLRTSDTKTGSAISQHKFGRAFDTKYSATTAEKIVEEMTKLGLFKDGKWRQDPNPIYDPFRYMTTVERSVNGVPCSWLHIDNRTYVTGNGAIVPLDL